jgi:hypothetical protein
MFPHEVNMHKPRKRLINANYSENGAWMNHKQPNSQDTWWLDLGRVPHFPPCRILGD